MVQVRCDHPGCGWASADRAVELAAVLAAELQNHTSTHAAPAAPAAPAANPAAGHNNRKPPPIERPKIQSGGTEEDWSMFQQKWEMFKTGSTIPDDQLNHQLYQCCVEALGEDLLRVCPNVTGVAEDELLTAIKQLAIQPVAISVRRTELLNLTQDRGEPIRSFQAKVKGKALTCNYRIRCSCDPPQDVDYTDCVMKDVLLNGLADEDIKKEVLGLQDLDTLSIADTVARIETKETARNAMTVNNAAAGMSTFRKDRGKQSVEERKLELMVKCGDCDARIHGFVKVRDQLRERKFCRDCFIKSHRKDRTSRPVKQPGNDPAKNKPQEPDSASALFELGSLHLETADHRDRIKTSDTVNIASMGSPRCPDRKAIVLDHHIFIPGSETWRKGRSLPQPTVRLSVSTDEADYRQFGLSRPNTRPSYTDGVADTGAQSCLMGTNVFYKCGFKRSDLVPVKNKITAANRSPIKIYGALLLRLNGTTPTSQHVQTAAVVYVSPDADKFYLSRGVMVDLGIISEQFPLIGDGETMAAHTQEAAESGKTCSCPKRTMPPGRPDKFPVPRTKGNIPVMKQWLQDRFSSSTFNKCPHQKLPMMEGPPLKLMVDPGATPTMVNIPATIPLHWMDDVKKQLEEDVALGVIEPVPIGEKPTWCHRMVLARKPNGSPRRTVDLSPLNRHCVREPHHVKPPFQQAKSIPSNTYKTVVDAWNGFHSVPIRKEDRHLTTFITPFGRFRYCTAPQGYLASGDGYTRRYDEIIAGVERKTKAVDDTVLWDQDLETHWQRVYDYLELVGRCGIVLNPEKFQFCEREVEFAGFKVTDTTVEPLPKFLAAIRDFPRPTSLTDIRSWFGLINQCSHYGQLSEMMLPYKHLLSPRAPFKWTDGLEALFQESKRQIIAAIQEGVRIFDMDRPTCLRTDWSKTGIGFFLGQKHCNCTIDKVGCCPNGWRITLAGSRFLRPSETRYAPVEGESLAIAWALEQTRYFTQGCDSLIIATDHNPLVKLFGDRTLDEITNPRLFRLKQRTLSWRFRVQYVPGKLNPFADAVSRNPSRRPDDDEPTMEQVLAGLRTADMDDETEPMIIAAARSDLNNVNVVSWDRVKIETGSDPTMYSLANTIRYGFPESKEQLDESLREFWQQREDLYVIDGVVMYQDRVVIPPGLRQEVLAALHSAHQGTTAMSLRAQSSVFWPGITAAIATTRANCRCCERNAPSQPRMPPIEPHIPTTPFEAIVADYFHLEGNYFLVIGDRLSGWTEVKGVRKNSFTSGAAGLCAALRSMFVTFGVPVEISSDGGPEFKAHETESFLKRWGVKHRLSSAYLPHSNGRAELAVKSTKRLLADNIGAGGDIDTDKVVQALLIKRNTPDPDCKLSPAEVIFGRKIRDTLPYTGLQSSPMVFENKEINTKWREAWSLKEEALRQRYMRNIEKLDSGSRLQPPLRHGDRIWVQNQAGRYSTKWDRSGTIVETHPHDQYTVKMDGSGRLSLRNRQFLRKIVSHDLFGSQRPAALPMSPTPGPAQVLLPVPCQPPPAVPPAGQPPAAGYSPRPPPR